MMSVRQTIVLSCVAVATSQYNYQQFLQRGAAGQHRHSATSGQQYDWHQYVPASERTMVESEAHGGNHSSDWHQYANRNNDWHQYVHGNHSNTEQYNWHQYAHMGNASNNEFDWHQYAHMRNASNDEFDWHQYAHMRNASNDQFDWHRYVRNTSELVALPGNFSGDASDATTEDQLNVWRERAQIQIHHYVPKAYQNESLAEVDAEYQRNLDRIDGHANATVAAPTEAPAPADVTEAPAAVTEAPAAATEAPAVTVPVVATEPVNAGATNAVSLSESPLRQASPMLLMFALLAGAAVFAVAVGSRHRRAAASSEPLLPKEYTVLP